MESLWNLRPTNVNFFEGFNGKCLLKNQVGWKDSHCTSQACVEEITSAAHPGRNKGMPRFSDTEMTLLASFSWGDSGG